MKSTRPLRVEELGERVVPSVVTVSAKSNIYGAGLATPPSPGGGGGGLLPVPITLASLGNPAKVVFPTVTGTVSGWAAAGGYNGPDGGQFWGGKSIIPAWKGISGILNSRANMFLVGVFLGPNGQPANAPKSLDVTAANGLPTVRPVLGQQFFIGDGRTSSHYLSAAVVPAGASKLYLGFAEGWGFGHNNRPGFYDDNGGSLQVDVESPGDIAITSTSWDQDRLAFGYDVIKNVGPSPMTVGVYRSNDQTLDSTDTQIATQKIAVPPNSSGTGSFALPNLSSTGSGQYLLVVADPPSTGRPNGLIFESDESNNTAALLAPTINLHFLSLQQNRTGNQSPKQSNGDYEARFWVSAGTLPSDPAVTLSVYWAKGNTLADKLGSPILTTALANALPVGPLSPAHSNFMVPIGLDKLTNPPTGATRMLVVLDEAHALREFKEDDNIGSRGNLNGALSFELQRVVAAPPAVTREERVRLWIQQNAGLINSAATTFRVSAAAIAGTIAWEALQNVSSLGLKPVGPGKVHSFEFRDKSAAELVEGPDAAARYGLANPLPVLSILDRRATLKTADGAIRYIAAILNAYASEAEIATAALSPDMRAQWNLRSNAGVLASYYVGEGLIDPRDKRSGPITLVNAATALPTRVAIADLPPVPGTTMGQWVAHNQVWLQSALT